MQPVDKSLLAPQQASPHINRRERAAARGRRKALGNIFNVCTMTDVENLPKLLSFANIRALEDIKVSVKQRLVRPLTPSSFERAGGVKPHEARQSYGSFSPDSPVREDSDNLLPFIVPVPPGRELLGLPESRDLLKPQDVHVLSNLLTGKISREDQMSIPSEMLVRMCEQAIAEMHYVITLSQVLYQNLDLLELPSVARAAIAEKLEAIERPYRFLKSDLAECMEALRRGEYTHVERKLVSVSSDHPEGETRLVTNTINMVDRMASCWTSILRDQEEWRKAMPAARELKPDAEIPKIFSLSEDEERSGSLKVAKLISDAKLMKQHWEDLASMVGVDLQATYSNSSRKKVSGKKRNETEPDDHKKQEKVRDIFPAVYKPKDPNTSLAVERLELPVVMNIGRILGRDDEPSRLLSLWVLPEKPIRFSREEKEVFSTREEAEKKLHQLNSTPQKPFGAQCENSPEVVECYSKPVTTKPEDYFNYQPVAIHGIKKSVGIGYHNCRKIQDPAYFLQRETDRRKAFTRKMEDDWEFYGLQLQEAVIDHWNLRIPSLQEAADVICEQAHRRETERRIEAVVADITSEMKKKGSLWYKVDGLVHKLTGKVDKPDTDRMSSPESRLSGTSSQSSSPDTDRRRLITIQSDPELKLDSVQERGLSSSASAFELNPPVKMNIPKKLVVPEILIESGDVHSGEESPGKT